MLNIYTYRLLTILLSPVLNLYLFIRKLRGKEDAERFNERMGRPKIKRPEGKIVWFHAASVGESNSVMSVVKDFLNRHKKEKITVLFTSGTTLSAKSIGKKIEGYKVIHQYVPIDKYSAVKRFLKHWKPNILLTVESEFWPNLITLTHKSGCPVIVINGKMTERSLKGWNKRKSLRNTVFSCVDLCFPQSTSDERRFLEIGVQNMNYLGNLKFDVPTLQGDTKKVKELKNALKTKKQVLAFASTHEKEEEIIAQIHKKLKEKYPDLLTAIILRHPKRKDEVVKMLGSDYDLKVAVRTENAEITKDTDIYLCDTFGEMGIMFRAFDIVMMAGSLVDNIGGHTPVEPAKLNCAILSGPYVFNNKGLFAELEKNDACVMVEDKGKMVENTVKEVSKLFNNPNRVSELKQNAYKVSMGMGNVTKKVVDVIEKEFKEILK